MLRSFTGSLLLLLLFLSMSLSAQNGVLISDDAGDPDPSAVLHLDVDNRGFLAPRMTTTQRNAIVDPADGLLIYNTSQGYLNYYDNFVDEWFPLVPPRERRTVDTTQTLYLSSAHFHPASAAQNFSSNFGQGGAYFTSGTNRAVAPLPLPAGTRITSVTVYYKDNSTTSEISLGLKLESLTSGLFNTISNFTTGVGTASDTWTSASANPNAGSHVLQANVGYFIDAYSTSWSSDIRIKGAKIVYTLPTSN